MGLAGVRCRREGARRRPLALAGLRSLLAWVALGFAGAEAAPLPGQRADARGGSAQQASQGRHPRLPEPEGDLGAVPTGELVKMLDAYAVVQAQEALSLGDGQYGEFVTRLRRLQDVRRRGQRERNLIVQELRKLSRPQPADEATLRSRLQALRDHDERTAAEMRKAYDALDQVLDLRQQARFRVFEETIERRKLDLIVRARERAARSRAGR